MSEPSSLEKLDGRPAAIVGWAVYLASSWTWCVGMYLPVLLVRDYGPRGWTVFAIPNVLGAAAMGWTIVSAARMRELAGKHRSASLWFSIVTIVFQVYFAAWFVRRIMGADALIAVLVIAVLVLAISRRKSGLWLAGAAALAVSIGVLARLWMIHAVPIVPRVGLKPAPDLFFVGAAMTFGFLLNPYLDLTFQRARSNTTPMGARAAFTLGFGLFFLIMIAMTLAYSGLLAGLGGVLSRAIALLLCAHFVTQLALTIAFHARELSGNRNRLGRAHSIGGIALLLGAALGATIAQRPLIYHGVELGEIGYWLFIGFYGIVFPTYAWFFIVPKAARLTPASLLVLFTATLMALPLFWMGFIEGEMPAVATALLILLGSKFFALGAGRLRPRQSAR